MHVLNIRSFVIYAYASFLSSMGFAGGWRRWFDRWRDLVRDANNEIHEFLTHHKEDFWGGFDMIDGMDNM